MISKFKKIGQINPKHSRDIKHSKIGLGFEKLDRNVFDPEKAYDKVEELGVKWARLQSGWARTETEKGVYNFEWIDKIVDNFVDRGIEPWICLCYGNALYNEEAKEVFGAVGCPPIFTDEQKKGWENYVTAFAEHFKGRVHYYEVWNEPDSIWCWKHGANAVELGKFTADTAQFVKKADPDAKIIGGAVCQRNLAYLNTALKSGMAEHIDYVSFHEYVHDETRVFETVEAYSALAKHYNPKIGVIQGESGSQSRSDGHGALRSGCWTPEIQAKQLARHLIADIMTNVLFTSYFSCMDMIEALNGVVGDTNSYLDYGYFGVLGADFDENGFATGEYYKKPSYYTLQNICSVFADDVELCTTPLIFWPEESWLIFDKEVKRTQVVSGGFKKKNGKAFVYWYPSNIMTTSVNTTTKMRFFTEYKDFKLVDIMDGSIYEIPENLIEDMGDGVYFINNMPVKDTPLMLVFGDFIDSWEKSDEE